MLDTALRVNYCETRCLKFTCLVADAARRGRSAFWEVASRLFGQEECTVRCLLWVAHLGEAITIGEVPRLSSWA
jgi:hypothetical protein